CAVREIKRKHREPRVVACALEVGTEKPMREIGAPAVLEIHHGECDFAHHVDPAHLIVELDAVEDDELAVDPRDVAEMQIAVALADEATATTLLESVAAAGVLALGPVPEALHLIALGIGYEQRRDLIEVSPREVQNTFGRAESPGDTDAIDDRVKGSNLRG